MKKLIKKYKDRIEEIKSNISTLSKRQDISESESEIKYEAQLLCFMLKREKDTLYSVISDLEKQLKFDNLDYCGFVEWLEECNEPFTEDNEDTHVSVCPTNKKIDDRVFSNDGGWEIH